MRVPQRALFEPSVACGLLVFALAGGAGCGSSAPQAFDASPEAGVDGQGTLGGPDGGGGGDAMLGTDAPLAHTCDPTSEDLGDCDCPTPGATRACYTADPKTRNTGSCKDGTQSCVRSGEFSKWSACTGAVTPGSESCSGTVDSNCNGKVGCADPTCAKDPACQSGCTTGQTRPCYDGPSGTENVGTCKDGKQTCVNGQWPPTCTGEVTPEPENCCDALDHNCNGAPGCFDILYCITAMCCQSSCDPMKTDPGCVCMTGAGDTATCPKGDHYVHTGGIPGTDECCPCAVKDCGDYNCCGEPVCAGSSWCANENCSPLPASCNGQVSADCDDFPEDCDEPCCECNGC